MSNYKTINYFIHWTDMTDNVRCKIEASAKVSELLHHTLSELGNDYLNKHLGGTEFMANVYITADGESL
mgnify:CR=1